MTDEKKWKVYCHTNKLNGKKYVGITSKSLSHRFGANGAKYIQSRYFWNAIDKYGWDGFSHELLADGLSKEDACEMEKKLIAEYDLCNRSKGYNIKTGGVDGKGMSEEGRLSISLAHSGPDSPSAVPIVSFDLNGHRCMEFAYIKFACEYYGVSDSAIWSALTSENKTAAGHLFRYAKNVEGVEQFSEEYMETHVRVRHYKNGRHANCTDVVLFDRTGKRAMEFSSMKEAAAHFGVYRGSISGVVRGKTASVKGYYVRLKQDVGDAQSIDVSGLYDKLNNIAVIQLDSDMSVVAEYSSLREAAKSVNGEHKQIKNAALKGYEYRGFFWRIPPKGGVQ